MNCARTLVGESAQEVAMKELLCGAVSSLFQPIVELESGKIAGYEILSRGIPPIESAFEMFRAAEFMNCSPELEWVCCTRALESIALRDPDPDCRFFLNFSIHTLLDENLFCNLYPESLKKYGLTPDRIVIELSEKAPVPAEEPFASLVSSIRRQGFSFAIDDLGSGYSSLRTIVATSPSYLKIDMGVIRDIHESPERLKIVKALIDFGASIDAQVIAEGVEKIEEYRALADHGLKLVQGYLFGRPEVEMRKSSRHVPFFEKEKSIHSFSGMFGQSEESERAETIVKPCHSIPPGSMTCAESDHFFSRHPAVDHFVVAGSLGVEALVTRHHFYSRTAGAFGYSLNQNRPVEVIAKRSFLSVSSDEAIRNLYRVAMERAHEDVYDPVIVLNPENRFLGTVTIRQLVMRAGEIETDSALNRNPLSGLPGNRMIERWILGAQRSGRDFVIAYADLANFKEFNDRYGFIRGDDMIGFTASVLTKALKINNIKVMLGHVGGDDFVFISDGDLKEDILENICKAFDEGKTSFFTGEDLDKGYYYSLDRKGNSAKVPLVTMNISVISSTALDQWKHPAEIAQIAAELKRKVKQQSYEQGKSSFLFDRRTHQKSPAPVAP
jgi:EAL domain-containing protein (putative c-di-GMP-specific phosphodiesterase class I)/GGDEF domain-containing protein